MHVLLTCSLLVSTDLWYVTQVDFSNLAASPDYRDKSSPESFYSTAVPAIKARAKWVRTWLRYSTVDAQKIVVVCHGDLIRFLTLGSMATGLFGHGEIRR
jgi:broad specificity phosphatase PhoE